MKNKKYDLDYFEAKDEPGNSYLESIGFDSLGNEVWWKYGCDKRNCSCVGSWANGNSNEVETCIDRP